MTLFRNDTAKGIWLEVWCDQCCHPVQAAHRHAGGPQCPILERALRTERKPVEWTRNTRAQTADAAYRCAEYTHQPKVIRRGRVADETPSMFDEAELTGERNLVPVEGWPDYHALKRKDKGGEHA